MDSLIIERNGKQEIYYSSECLKRQIEMAYKSGLHRGIKVQFHAVTPMNGGMLNDLTNEFKNKVEEEYKIAFANSEVWRVC